MSTITAEELYIELLKIKDSDNEVTGIELMQFGEIEYQLQELINQGKIVRKNNILDSIIVY